MRSSFYDVGDMRFITEPDPIVKKHQNTLIIDQLEKAAFDYNKKTSPRNLESLIKDLNARNRKKTLELHRNNDNSLGSEK